MLRYKHLKPQLLIYLVTTLLLSLASIGVTVTIIVNEINGFSFSYVQYLSCPLYTTYKLNTFLEIILKVSFIMSIFAILLALAQFAILIWQYLLLKKQIEEKGDKEENTFQNLTFGKLIILYLLNAMGFMCLVPMLGSFLTLYIELSTCTDPSQNKSSLYLIPTAVAGVSLLFQMLSFSILLKLVYHYEHTANKSQKDEQQKTAYPKQNKYRADNKIDRSDPKWAQKNKELQEMQRMRKRISEARMQMANISGYQENGYFSTSTSQGSPRPFENGLLGKYPKHSNLTPDDSIYDSPKIIGSSLKKKLPKQKKNKYNSNKSAKTPNKYAHNPTNPENNHLNPNTSNQVRPNNQPNQVNPNNQLNPNNQVNQNQVVNKNNPATQNNAPNGAKIPNKNNPYNLANSSNQLNSVYTNPSKNFQNVTSSNSTQNSQQNPVQDKKIPTQPNGDNIKQMNAQQISVKQKELMKTLPKNPHKMNISSKHQPQIVIFEQSDSEEGSEFINKPLLSHPNNQPSNSKPQGVNQSKLNPTQNNQPNKRKGSSSLEPNSNSKNQLGYPSESLNESSVKSPNLSPLHGPENPSFDLHDDQINLNDSPPVNQPMSVKYLNSPYLKNLKNKNITPEQRRNLKRPFLKITGNVFEFDSRNYSSSDPNFINQNKKSAGNKEKKNAQKDNTNQPSQSVKQDTNFVNLLLPLPLPNNSSNNQSPQNDQINLNGNLSVDPQHLNSQRKSRNPQAGVNSFLKGIFDAKTHQEENPIINYIQEDEQYEDKLQKILDYDKISKKRRRYIYNPFETENKNDEKLYLHKNKAEKALLMAQNLQSPDYDAFRDQDFDNVNYGKMVIEDDGHGNPVLRVERVSSKTSDNAQSQAKKNKKQVVLLDFIRSKHVID